MAVQSPTEMGHAVQKITADEDFHIPSKSPMVDADQFIKLNLACGQQQREGWKGVDRVAGPNVDYVVDLLKYPWPFADNSIYEIGCSHFVEHLTDLVSFMRECHRILQPLQTMTIVCPYYSSRRAWQDPTHVRAITEDTFRYFDPEWAKLIRVDHYMNDGSTGFEVINTIMMYNNEYESKGEEARMWALAHNINVVDDITVILRKRDVPK